MSTATVYEIRVLRRDRVRLLLAKCDRCDKDVMHGGGRVEEPLLLESRVAHCKCPGLYELVLADGVDAT